MKQFMGFKKDAAAIVNGTNGAVGAAGATTPEMLATAVPGIYGIGATGKLIMIDTAAKFLNVKSFLIARGNAKGSNPLDTNDTAEGAIFSDEIVRKNLTVEKYLPINTIDSVPLAKAKVITLGGANSNLIGGVTPAPANAVAGVTIIDTVPNIMTDWKVRTYEVKAAGLDAAAVALALANKIMADPNRLVDAVAVGATTAGALQLTHRKIGITFDAHGTDGTVCENCAKTIVQPVRAEGTVANLRELELECAGYQGQTRRGDGQLGDILPYTQIEIDTLKGCVVYHLTWLREVNRQGTPVDNKASRFLRLYLAVPAENIVMIPVLDTLLLAATQDDAGASADQGPLLVEADVEAAIKQTEKESAQYQREAEKKAKEGEKVGVEVREKREEREVKKDERK